MKKYILSISLTSLLMSGLQAAEYTGTIEPFESFSIKSQTSGLVENIDFEDLTYASKNSKIVIEKQVEIDKLKNMKNKLSTMKEIYKLKKENVDSYNSLNTVSNTNKNDKNIELLNLKSSIFDIENNINDLEFTLSKKDIQIHDDNIFIKDVKVYKGEVIQQGQILLDVENHNKSKIVFYVNKKDVEKVKNREFKITVDGIDLTYDSIEIDKSTDKVYISSYKVEIESSTVKDFGKIVNIVIED